MKPNAVPPCVTNLETGLADAVLSEIAELLKKLADSGEASGIDLKSLPMSDGDRDALEQRLGQGEVFATVGVAGTTEVWETSYPGVWWVRHLGADGMIASEEVAVTRTPEILTAHRKDISAAEQRLRAELNSPAPGESETEALHV